MGAQMALIGVGLGLTISPISTAVLNDAREEERGSASALVLILRLVGMTLAVSSLTVFSLERVDQLVADYEPEIVTETGTDPETGEIIDASIDANFEAAVQTIGELQLIGAAVSFVGMLFALLLRGGQHEALQRQQAERRVFPDAARGDPPG